MSRASTLYEALGGSEGVLRLGDVPEGMRIPRWSWDGPQA
jgi:hypothetical protein